MRVADADGGSSSEEAAQLSRKEMVDDLLHEGYKLVGNGSLSIPIIIWDGSTEREQGTRRRAACWPVLPWALTDMGSASAAATIDRLGFLFGKCPPPSHLLCCHPPAPPSRHT